MKRVLFIALILFCVLSPVRASAEPLDYLEDFEEILPDDLEVDVTDPNALTEAVGFEAILLEIYGILKDNGAALLGFLFTLMGLSVLGSLGTLVDIRLRSAVGAAISLVSAVTVSGRLVPIIRSVTVALSQTGDFFGALIPIFTGITVAGGGVSTATVEAAGMSVSLAVIGAITSEILAPAVSVLFVFGMLSDLGSLGGGLMRVVKGFFTWGIGIAAFLFGAAIALQTVISTASDGMLMRTAKFAASSSVPMIGSAVGGAMSTLASGLSYVKGITGGGAVAVIAAIALAPLVLLFAYRAILSLATSFLGFIDAGGGMRCFSAMLAAIDSLIATLSVSTIVYIFQIILFIKSGVAVL